MKTIKFNVFGTLYEITFQIKVTKKVPRYATVKSNTNWIYAGHRFKVDSVYMEPNKFTPEYGRSLRLSLEGTKFQEQKGYKTTVIDEIDLILEY